MGRQGRGGGGGRRPGPAKPPKATTRADDVYEAEDADPEWERPTQKGRFDVSAQQLLQSGMGAAWRTPVLPGRRTAPR